MGKIAKEDCSMWKGFLITNNVNSKKKSILKKIITVLIFLSLTASAIGIFSNSLANTSTNNRTGDEGNQPATGYAEGTEKFEIYHDDNVHNTTFAPNENITIKITSNVLNWNAGGPSRRNQIDVYNYYGNRELHLADANAFTQQPGGPPYVYLGKFQAPGTPDHYLIDVQLRDSPQQNKDEIEVSDVIQVGAGATPPKHIATYSDSACTTLDWIFGSADNVYIKVYTPNTIDPADASIIFSDYVGNSTEILIEDLATPTVTKVGNDSIITFNLFDDLDFDPFTDNELKGNYWYTISVDLNDLVGAQMATDWAAQIRILPPPDIKTFRCAPISIFAEGTNTTTISLEFTDQDAISYSEFIVTFRVRAPGNSVITLLDNKTHGQGGLTLTSLGGNRYNASYIWDPPDAAILGDYDIYARVYDGQNGVDVEEFNDNRGRLTLLQAGVPPVVVAGNTTCYPDRINKMNNEMTMFVINFTDANDPQLNNNDFFITIKVRDEDNNEIIIIDNKNTGNQGDAQGTTILSVIRYVQNLYRATIAWNPEPDITVPVGFYDLYFSVTTIYGTATDGFGNNDNELEIYSSGYSPELNVGDTTCIPSSVDIIGNKQTMIYCEFTDPDNPDASTFNVTFKVRPPNNRIDDAITLVDNKADNGAGEFGGVVTVEQSGTNYVASYHWDPPVTVDVGFYDLYFMVSDAFNNTVEDSFQHNIDELELITSVTPPSISAGNTKCVPSSVNKIGTGTTKIYCEFTDSTFASITNFTVTFKVRDPNNNEIILVDDKPNGATGEDINQTGKVEISYSGTVFTAWYEWDPPAYVDPGRYDLYFGVKNLAGGYAKDDFNNNRDELTIETTGNPPIISKTDCVPSSITIKGAVKTTIFVEFTDADNPTVTNFTVTFRVRDPLDDNIILVNDKTDDGPGEFGGTLTINASGNVYIASYDWDPPDTTLSGMYDLFAEVKDETFAEAQDGFDSNQNELELTGGAVIPGAPKLESGTSTHIGNVYNFTITYTDEDNDPPTQDGILLIIGTDTYEMKESEPDDTNYTDGKQYYYSLELEDGNYTYYFKVTNIDNEVFETDQSPLTVKPEGKEKDTEEDYTILIVAVIVILIIVFLLVIFMLVKRKSTEPYYPDYRQPSERQVSLTQMEGLPEGEEGKEQEPEVGEPTTEPEPGEAEPTEEPAPEEGEQPPEEQAPAEEEKPPEEQPPAEQAPAEEEQPTEEQPPDEQAPAEEEQPPEEQPPEEQAPPEQEQPPKAAPLPSEQPPDKQSPPMATKVTPEEKKAPPEEK